MLNKAETLSFSENDIFNKLVKPIEANHKIRDAEFYVRKDGLLFNADGYAHPHKAIVGNPLYLRDKSGDKEIFGDKYRKIFFYRGTNEPVPYVERPKLLESIDPKLNQFGKNFWPLQYEQMVRQDDLLGYIPGENSFREALLDSDSNEGILRNLENFKKMLGLNLENTPLAFTGSLALGNWKSFHDFDLMFRGDLSENRKIADAMRALVMAESRRRLHEGGKSWLIRFFNDQNVIICSFFGYKNIADAPIKDLKMFTIEEDVRIEGTVSDATHALYTPSVVYLHDVKMIKVNNEQVNIRLSDNMPLIIYHTGSRGEFNVDDRVWAHGGLLDVATVLGRNQAVVVVEREGIRNETPPWPNYYSRPRYE